MSKSHKYLCIHGHFYQPPRENPWTEEIESQDSAAPFHDWNERILEECYFPNYSSRILDDSGRIIDMVNNYKNISFNIGPTLLSWIEEKYPTLYRGIIEADRESRNKFSGHGNAIAQIYNHIIMPLASPRDKITQIIWGLKEFEARFARKAEGIWLSEMAVDKATLQQLAEKGIKFTILSEYQAKSVRKIGETEWINVHEKGIDTTRAYRCKLDNDKYIDLFFYNAGIAKGVAFEGILNDGDGFIEKLKGAFTDRTGGQIVHIATDGESYGHHHKFGDMALSYATSRLAEEENIKITNYGEFLEKYPPEYYVEIVENSSWSCAHGVGRWKSDCGCSTGGAEKWNQKWREPLRETLNWLKTIFDEEFEKRGHRYASDPWEARNDYINVILSRSETTIESFFQKHAKKEMESEEKINFLKLLEMQRNGLFMFTSCGWFFNDISGIETIQILLYAGKGIEIATGLGVIGLEEKFLSRLTRCKSNIHEQGDGSAIYKKNISTAIVDIKKHITQYAIINHLYEYPETETSCSFIISKLDFHREEKLDTSFSFGHISIFYINTCERAEYIFCCLYTGGYDFFCASKTFFDKNDYMSEKEKIIRCYLNGKMADVIEEIKSYFGVNIHGIEDLLYDQRKKVINAVLEKSLRATEDSISEIYNKNRKLINYLFDINLPIPSVFKTAAENKLKRLIDDEHSNVAEVYELLVDIKRFNFSFDYSNIRAGLKLRLEKIIDRINPSTERESMDALSIIDLNKRFDLNIDLWQSQFKFNEYLRKQKQISKSNIRYTGALIKLGESLNFSNKLLEPI